MMKKRSDTRAKLSVPALSSTEEDIAPDDRADERWNEVLAEITAAEDTDPFTTGNEIRLAFYLARLATELAAQRSPNAMVADQQSVKREFWDLFRRKKGIAGIREFVAQRFQECNQLRNRLPGIQKMQQIERETKRNKRRTTVENKSRGDRKSDSDRTTDDEPIDERPIIRLRQVLEQFDKCLEMLECSSVEQPHLASSGPDPSAALGLGLAFGLELGTTAAQMRYHSELACAVQAGKKYKQTGNISKPTWQSQNPKEAKLLVSDVLRNVLINNASW